MPVCRFIAPLRPKFPVMQKMQFFEIRIERAVRRHLDAEILEHRDAGSAGDTPRNLAHQSLGQSGARAVISDRNLAQSIEEVGAAGRMFAQKIMRDEIFLHHHRKQRAQAKRIGAGPQLADDNRPARQSRSGADRSRSARDLDRRKFCAASGRALWKPCDCHGFLPTKTATSACSKSGEGRPPVRRPSTQNSPVFSCASALEA